MMSSRFVRATSWMFALVVVFFAHSAHAEEPASPGNATPTRADLHAAEHDWDKKRRAQKQAERDLEAANAAQLAALAEVTSDPTNSDRQRALKEASETVRNAKQRRQEAEEARIAAEDRLDALEREYEKARRWVHAFGAAISAARAADQTNRLGFGARYTFRFGAAQSFDALFGMDWFRFRGDGSNDKFLRLGTRMNHGESPVMFFYGLGLSSEPAFFERTSRRAVFGELGVALRIGNDCSPTGTCLTPSAETRVFLQPWAPLDGNSVAMLFGLEIGAALSGVRAADVD